MKIRWVWILGASALLVGAFQWMGHEKESEVSSPRVPSQTEPGRRTVRAVAPEPPPSPELSSPELSSPVAPSTQPAPPPVSGAEDVLRHQEDAERQFASEPVNPRWANSTAHDISAQVDQLEGVELVELECRSNSCFVELGFQPEEMNPTALADRLSVIAPWPAYVVSEVRTEPPYEAWAWLRQIDSKAQ
jgi:hypothetical protein